MSIYLKLMYDQWVQGQSELEIRERYYVFVERAARTLHRSEDEVLKELLTTTWFKIDNNTMI